MQQQFVVVSVSFVARIARQELEGRGVSAARGVKDGAWFQGRLRLEVVTTRGTGNSGELGALEIGSESCKVLKESGAR